MDPIATLNQGTPSAAAQIPYYDPANGQGRRASMGALAETVGTLLATPGAIPGASLVLTADGLPSSDVGYDGWLAADPNTGALYLKVNGSWVVKDAGNAPSALAVTGSPVLAGTVGQNYAGFLVVAGGGVAPYTYSDPAGSLPDGLSIHPGIGLVHGIPVQAGVSGLVALVATDATGAQAILAPFSIDVVAAGSALALFGNPLASATVGIAYSFALSATGGTAPYTYAVASGALPAGVTLNTSTGLVSGTPTTAGTASDIVLSVTDGAAATVRLAPFSVVVSAAPVVLSISGTPSTTAVIGTPYSFTPSASGGTAPYTFALIAGTLPAGLSFNTSTGAITGTPTTAGAASGLTIRVTDSVAATATLAAFTLTVTSDVVGPTVISHPADQTVDEGAPATFVAVFDSGGETPTYEWETRPDSGSAATTIPGATSASYTDPSTAVGDTGQQYRCIATNSAGSTATNWATLTVESVALPAVHLAQPVDGSVGNLTAFPHVVRGRGPNADKFMVGTIRTVGFAQVVELRNHDTGALVETQTIRTHNEENDHCPAVAAAFPDGSFAVAACGHNTNLSINIAYRDPAGAWTTETLTATGADVTYPNLLIDNSNTLWLFIRTRNYEWSYFRKPPGGAWSAQTNIITMGAGQLYCTPFRHNSDTNRVQFWARPNSAESAFGTLRRLELDCTTETFHTASGPATLPIDFSTVPVFKARPSGFQLNVHDTHGDVLFVTRRQDGDGNQSNTAVEIWRYDGSGDRFDESNWTGQDLAVYNQAGVMGEVSAANLTTGGCIAREPLPSGVVARCYGTRRVTLHGTALWQLSRYDYNGTTWAETPLQTSTQHVTRAVGMEGATANSPTAFNRMSGFRDYNDYDGAIIDWVRPTDGARTAPLLDTFTEASAVVLSDHTSDSGAAWARKDAIDPAGVMSVGTNGRTYSDANAGYVGSAAVFDGIEGYGEFVIQRDSAATNSMSVGLLTDPTAFDGYYIGASNNTNAFSIAERVAGVNTTLGSPTRASTGYSATLAPGDTVQTIVRSVPTGVRITALVNSRLLGSYVRTTPRTGQRVDVRNQSTAPTQTTGIGHDLVLAYGVPQVT